MTTISLPSSGSSFRTAGIWNCMSRTSSTAVVYWIRIHHRESIVQSPPDMSNSPKSTYHMPVDGQLLSPIMATDRQTSCPACHASLLVAAYLNMPAVPKSGPPTTVHSRPPSTADSSPPAARNSSHPAATDSSVPAQCNQRRRMRRKRQHSALILCIELTPVQAPDQSPVQAPAPDQSPVLASRNRCAAPASWEQIPVPEKPVL